MTIVMPSDILPASFRPKKRLGFSTRVSFNDDIGPAQVIRDGIELFREAERLGYQSGCAYQRHFENHLSSPLPFFAVAAPGQCAPLRAKLRVTHSPTLRSRIRQGSASRSSAIRASPPQTRSSSVCRPVSALPKMCGC